MTTQRTINLPPKAVISECGPILTALKQHIESGFDVIVVSDEVKQIDLAMLQVLISAKKTAERDGKSFAVRSDRAGVFEAALADLGMSFPEATDRAL